MEPEDRDKAAEYLVFLLGMQMSVSELPKMTVPRRRNISYIRTGLAPQFALQLYNRIRSQIQQAVSEFLSGGLLADELLAQLETALKGAHSAMARMGMIAAGNVDDRIIAGIEAEQSLFLQKFKGDIKNMSPKQIAARVMQYPEALIGSFNVGWVYGSGSGVVRWMMNPVKEHCDSCLYAVSHSSNGLPPGHYNADELPFIPGRTTQCLHNCGCVLEPIGGGSPSLHTTPMGDDIND